MNASAPVQIPPPPSGLGRADRSRARREIGAIAGSMLLGFVWWMGVAVGTIDLYARLGIKDPCTISGLGQASIGGWLVAVPAFVGGCALGWYASRALPRSSAAKRSVLFLTVMLVLEFLPFFGLPLFAAPYVVGLLIRARDAWHPMPRWTLACITLIVLIVGNSYWFDAYQCL